MKTFNTLLVGALSLAASTSAFTDVYRRNALAEAYAEADPYLYDDGFGGAFAKRDLYARNADPEPFEDDLFLSKRELDLHLRHAYAAGHSDGGIGLFRRWPPAGAPSLPPGTIAKANQDYADRRAGGGAGGHDVPHRKWNDPTPPPKPGPGDSSYFPKPGGGGPKSGGGGGSRRAGSA
jgi:hypothetical protein